MNAKKKEQISIIVLFAVTVIFSLIPVVQTVVRVNDKWQGVTPKYIDDDLYYYARIKEVVDGNPFIGNPYFMEHRDERSVAFFVADWIASIPFLMKIPFNLSIVINFVFWSLLFVLLVYFLARATELSSPYSALLSFFSYLEVYWVVFRPVVMQEVFPFFILFLLALIVWLKEPLNRRSAIFLMVASVLPFYIYTYLWQITSVILAIVFFHKLIQKKWEEIKILSLVAMGIVAVSLPSIIYTIYQIRSFFYWETVGRIGLVESYLPTIYAYQYGRWAVLLALVFILLKRWLVVVVSNKDEKVFLAAIYSGMSLFLISVSNIVTGKELETAQHAGRFITLWMAIFFPVVLWNFYKYRKELFKLNWIKLIVLFVVSFLCLGFLLSNFNRSLPFKKIAEADVVSIQDYSIPLNWLEKKETDPIVIWADEEISTYIPILTKHYVLWHPAGGLHLMSTIENEDRFLFSRIGTTTTDEIFLHYREFEGAGAVWRYSNSFYKNRINCFILKECREDIELRDWVGTTTIQNLLDREIELKNDLAGNLKKYKVSYIISDISKKEDGYFMSLFKEKEVWRNERFVIYKI